MKNRNFVSFLIIGTQKAGTSALDKYLRMHPEITMGIRKELHYFDRDVHFDIEQIDYESYHKLFSNKGNLCIVGECTPSYLYMQKCAERIYNYNKNIKLIAILANPINRAYSHWNMQRERKMELNDFQYCIENEKLRLKSLDNFQKKKFAYIDRGFYCKQIEHYYKYFSKQQLLIIKYEDYQNKQELILHKIFEFIGANPNNYQYNRIEIHKRKYLNPMTSYSRNYLMEIFRNEIQKLEELLKWDCSDWLI